MRQHYLLGFLFSLVLFASCQTNDNSFTVKGSIANMPKQLIYLEELSVNPTILTIDSANSDDKGNFEMSGKAIEPGLYRLRFQGNQFIMLSIDKGVVKVTSDWSNLAQYTVIGSPSSSSLQGFLQYIRNSLQDFNTLSVVIDSMRARGNDSLLKKAKADMEDMNVKLTQYVESYSDTTHYLPNAVFAVSMLNPATETAYLKTFSQSILTRFPKSELAKTFSNKLTQALTGNTAEKKGNEIIGQTAPEINLPSPSGKNISLSSLKGKYVLVDFWASWCGPCRAENPNVVEAYKKFKDKNFTILGVSLDNDKEKWMKAVADDNLTWNHVSDLQGWESIAARTYNVQSIPTNFLINPEGKIIATNLRGAELEATLEQTLK
jgi:peroxiredoxin